MARVVAAKTPEEREVLTRFRTLTHPDQTAFIATLHRLRSGQPPQLAARQFYEAIGYSPEAARQKVALHWKDPNADLPAGWVEHCGAFYAIVNGRVAWVAPAYSAPWHSGWQVERQRVVCHAAPSREQAMERIVEILSEHSMAGAPSGAVRRSGLPDEVLVALITAQGAQA